MIQILTILSALSTRSTSRLYHANDIVRRLKSLVVSLLILAPAFSEARFVVLANARTDDDLPSYFSFQFRSIEPRLKRYGWDVAVYPYISGLELRRVMEDPRVFPNAQIIGMNGLVYHDECGDLLFRQFWRAVQDL